jgi:hypothetical protein
VGLLILYLTKHPIQHQLRRPPFNLARHSPVQMQDRQDGPISDRVQKLVPMPSRSQRTRLGLSVPDHRQGDQVGPVEYGPEGVGDRVAEFTALQTRIRKVGVWMISFFFFSSASYSPSLPK